MAVSDIDIFGRKTFFIAGDSAIASTERLEELCARGYEAYSIAGDGDVKAKINAIAELYPNSIVFINADSKSGINARVIIKEMASLHRGTLLFGIMHNGSASSNREWSDCDLAAGVVALGDGNGFAALLDALQKTGAKGRRAYVRVNCDANSTAVMTIGGKTVHAKVEDVNISHFRCTLPEDIAIRIFDKVREAKMVINGLSITTDAVLIMKRTKMGAHSYVLMFIHGEDDRPDLEEKIKVQLNKTIYRSVSAIRMDSIRMQMHSK